MFQRRPDQPSEGVARKSQAQRIVRDGIKLFRAAGAPLSSQECVFQRVEIFCARLEAGCHLCQVRGGRSEPFCGHPAASTSWIGSRTSRSSTSVNLFSRGGSKGIFSFSPPLLLASSARPG